jgi:hypothetical protein
VTVTYHVLWMLCALGAIAFGAMAGRSWGRVAAFGAGFAAAAAGVAMRGLPDAPVVGAVAAVAVVLYLSRPRYALVAVAAGGALGGIWPELLWMQGLPRVVAWPAAALVVALPVWLARSRPGFAPPVLQDDALLGVLAMGAVLAVLPGVIDGWQAALALNIGAAEGGGSLPPWLVAAVMVALVMGAVHSVWSRR